MHDRLSSLAELERLKNKCKQIAEQRKSKVKLEKVLEATHKLQTKKESGIEMRVKSYSSTERKPRYVIYNSNILVLQKINIFKFTVAQFMIHLKPHVTIIYLNLQLQGEKIILFINQKLQDVGNFILIIHMLLIKLVEILTLYII